MDGNNEQYAKVGGLIITKASSVPTELPSTLDDWLKITPCDEAVLLLVDRYHPDELNRALERHFPRGGESR